MTPWNGAMVPFLCINLAAFMTATVAVVYSFIDPFDGAHEPGSCNRAYPLKPAQSKVQLSLTIFALGLTESLLIWRMYRLWLRLKTFAAFLVLLNLMIVGSGIFLVYFPQSTDMVKIYLCYCVGFFLATGIINGEHQASTPFIGETSTHHTLAGRTWWMLRQLKHLHIYEICPHPYSWTGTLTDTGAAVSTFALCSIPLSAALVPALSQAAIPS
ncbi:hypothetical protein FA13DRAFT_1715931 [Coprinellus micaceus]|uniref:Uncharacterized protein n=1 Tax=Coprinellus micaceus TaxID=71717 RepID=A0A4Y7SL75_COPMI|nr:hypothetical protein FA13DRAFT_1715931 [Coprinellus micaceus]